MSTAVATKTHYSPEDLLPGFRCPVRDIFPPRQAAHTGPDRTERAS